MPNSILCILKTPCRLMRRLYDWTMKWSTSKRSSLALYLVAFAESSFFPVPPDVLLIPMVIANRARWFRTAAICTIGSVTGALLGYLIGWVLWESVGKINIGILVLASAVGRAGRFFLVAGLLRVFGKKISDWIEKYFDLASLLFLALLIGGFLAIKHLK